MIRIRSNTPLLNRTAVVYPIIMVVLSVLMWGLLNQPNQLPLWPDVIQGFSFSPMRVENDPSEHNLPTAEQIESDIELLSGTAHAIRSYTVEGSLAEIPKLAAKHNLNVALGAWIGPDEESNKAEVEKLLQVYMESPKNIVRLVVGNETLLRGDVSMQQLIAHLDRVRSEVKIPVSTAEPPYVWEKNPELVKHVDYIMVHLLPYWEKLDVDQSIFGDGKNGDEHKVKGIKERMDDLKKLYPDKPIIIGEVGWPSGGPTRGDAVASVANEAKFLRNFLALAEKEGYTYYIMEAFDQVWKTDIEGAAGSAWGVFNAQRQPKFPLKEDVVRVPQWRTLAGICAGIALILVTLLFRDSKGLDHKGRGFLTMLTFGVVTATVWIVYDFTQRYLTTGTLIVGVVMILSACGICVVLLAEAHEWAEALWLREFRRTPVKPKSGSYKPKVSIHVPAYNEPPELLIDTLNALNRLDYPDFEVLVIDNNTKDPAIWQPVEVHCEQLGSRFRFFHVAPLAGFKAGALNFALTHTAPDAEIIAVIDSDYQVHSDWLSDLVPMFEDQQMAIVQAPQDYHDGDQSVFKAMINAEYQGFFHIGMVTRNERNAIIQHGTMTMVRQRVLREVNGWAEWCITEDAELGLRIFDRGYHATYVPLSYGQGVMPDTFIDYKKQRFRWAYGAVLILRNHLSSLLGLKKTKLDRGQRYHFLAGWLPWFADGVNLFFNVAALFWTALMLLWPMKFQPPEAMFSALPLSFFVFKISKMFFLYRWRIKTNYRQCFAAGLAGLALSHTIGRAMIAGFITSKIGFFRTPKLAERHRVLAALFDCREELLFAITMILAAVAVGMKLDTSMWDVRMWRLVLIVQSTPFCAAILVSLISALPQLPAWLIGPMKPINREHPMKNASTSDMTANQ